MKTIVAKGVLFFAPAIILTLIFIVELIVLTLQNEMWNTASYIQASVLIFILPSLVPLIICYVLYHFAKKLQKKKSSIFKTIFMSLMIISSLYFFSLLVACVTTFGLVLFLPMSIFASISAAFVGAIFSIIVLIYFSREISIQNKKTLGEINDEK